MSHAEDGPDYPPLDAAQLVRIAAVHKGFLFQHLYGAACLLSVGRQQDAVVIVERDEDIEIHLPDAVHYLQVKTRHEVLRPGDIADALTRFDTLRALHVGGARGGAPSFAVISNAELGPVLEQAVAKEDWPADVTLMTPSRPAPHGLPRPGTHLDTMFAGGVRLAADIPFGALSPETLMWKLTSLVQRAAAEGGRYRFTAQALPELFEQLLIQLQDFPEPPSPYRPQRNEPALVTDQRLRLIIGFSGAGKTGWASEAARHVADPLVYFNVGDLPSAAVATSLARELVARFLSGRAEGIGGAQLPASGGLDALRASSRQLEAQGLSVTVTLDNVHRLSAEDLRQVIEAAPSLKFVAMGQPWAGQALFEATLDVVAERLEGFGPDSVAAAFNAADVGIEADQALALISLTGGLPLYVNNAARLTATRFDHDLNAFVKAIRERTHDQATAQDIILETGFEALTQPARDAAALLSAVDVPLRMNEVEGLFSALELAVPVARCVRELRRASFLIDFPGAGIGLHDALRPLAGDHLALLDKTTADSGLERLGALLAASLHQERNIPRLTFLARLLPRIGQTDLLVEWATNEMFFEQGDVSMMWDALDEEARDGATSVYDRFWANDALAFWEGRDGGTPSVERVTLMEQLVEEGDLGWRERLNTIFKRFLIAGTAHDRAMLERATAAGRKLLRDKPDEQRLLRYNRALALFRMEAYAPARETLEPLIGDYCAAIGIRETQLTGANGPALLRLLEGADDRGEIKRLADALNLWSTVVVQMGMPPLLRRIQALKLYSAVGAGRSAASAAQDAADEMLDINGSAEGAREVMEQHLLPLIEHYHLTDMVLRARGQYAVILAYCGEFEAAARELELLTNYGGDLERVAELAGQARLILLIEAGLEPLERRRPPPGGSRLLRNPNEIGRRSRPDDPCPCRSGRKFKRCHGKGK